MEAKQANLLRFLQGTNQFVIPIYQRTYSWRTKQCQQLWNDIVRAGSDAFVASHFVGSIVYIHEGEYHHSSVPQLLVIDGQQRLTTLSLLLVALGKALGEDTADKDVSRKRINNYYLLNNEETGELRYKLLLTRSDKDTLTHLIEDREPPAEASTRVLKNFQFFQEQILTGDMDLNTLWKGIGKLLIVDISLDRTKDNPQLIFESLNSTGLDLSQADLIRNFVLMGLDPDRQKRLYNDYWYPMEQSFGHAQYSQQFNRFMRDYLTVKSRAGTIPRMDEVYKVFKTYLRNYMERVQSSDDAIDHVVAEVYRYSEYFANLAFEKEVDDQINEIFGSINKLKVDVAYPFLLEVYDDYSRSRLLKEDFIAILKMVESYVFRRAICEIPTNSLNKTFATLSRRIDKHDYLKSTQAAFLSMDSYRRFPSDDEFWFKFMVRDVYNFRSRNYLLDKLENHGRKEKVNIESYTIEHIMPQNENLSAAWQKDLGHDWAKDHAEYLHTIGNLTLTGYNSELSDRPFKDKRDMEGGFADSPIRLNATLRKLDHWNKEEIEKRADSLASMAITIWPLPDLSAQTSDEYKQTTPAEDEHEYTLDQFFASSPDDQHHLFTLLRTQLLNLDASVEEVVGRDHISYQSTNTFADVKLGLAEVRLCLHCKPDQLYDPEGQAMDATGQEHWSDGDTILDLSSADQIEYVMGLVGQCYELQLEESLARLL